MGCVAARRPARARGGGAGVAGLRADVADRTGARPRRPGRAHDGRRRLDGAGRARPRDRPARPRPLRAGADHRRADRAVARRRRLAHLRGARGRALAPAPAERPGGGCRARARHGPGAHLPQRGGGTRMGARGAAADRGRRSGHHRGPRPALVAAVPDGVRRGGRGRCGVDRAGRVRRPPLLAQQRGREGADRRGARFRVDEMLLLAGAARLARRTRRRAARGRKAAALTSPNSLAAARTQRRAVPSGLAPAWRVAAYAPPGVAPFQASASSSTSTQCFTGVVVPVCRCWMQPMLAETMVCASSGARLASLRSRSW